MNGSEAKDRLVNYLDLQLFRPVLAATPALYEEGLEKAKLLGAQRFAESERENFRHCGSAEEVRSRFQRDLTDTDIQDMQHQLRELNLPTLQDVADGFERLCQDLGVAR